MNRQPAKTIKWTDDRIDAINHSAGAVFVQRAQMKLICVRVRFNCVCLAPFAAQCKLAAAIKHGVMAGRDHDLIGAQLVPMFVHRRARDQRSLPGTASRPFECE